MKVLKVIMILIVVGGLWSTASLIKTYRMHQLEVAGKIPYGPIPNFTRNYYSYEGLHAAFNSKLDLKRANEFSKPEFEQLILNTLQPEAKQNFEKYIHSTLALSEDYQIDPFWIISIMMVESGFNLSAKSQKNARGLMQIKPETAGHLYQLMRKKVSEVNVNGNLHEPSENIEVGIFYLKKLLQNFRLQYNLATIAYNVGPNKLRDLLSNNEIDTKNFSYLNKVEDCYKDLTKHFARELKKKPYPFEATYVIKGQGRKFEEKILEIYVSAPPSLNSDFLLSSENLSNKIPKLVF